MSPLIQTINLTKEFENQKTLTELINRPFQRPKKILAVDNINIAINEKEIVCLLGENGAGKTTLLKLLSCLLIPTKGTAFVLGWDVRYQEDRIKSEIGFVSSNERSFYWRITGRQNLEFFANLYNLPRREIPRKIEDLARILKIETYLDRMVAQYSTGIIQRFAIARGLLNNPKILFIDEPTKNLDPNIAETIRHFIKEELVRKQNKTVVFTTHNLSEAEEVADTIGIMAKGKILAFGGLEDLRQNLESKDASLSKIFAFYTILNEYEYDFYSKTPSLS